MKKILFPTDLSEISRKALEYTISFARILEAEVTVMNTFQATSSPRRPFIDHGSLQEQTMERLREFAGAGSEELPGRVRFKAREDLTVRQLIKASKSLYYDLIVMGRSIRYDWLARLLGSRTTFVSARAHCPVLVLPAEATFSGIRKILIVNGRNAANNRYISNYLRQSPLMPGTELHYVALPGASPVEAPAAATLVGSIFEGAKWRYTGKNVQEKLEEYLQRHQIDLLVMPAEHMRFPGRLLHRCEVRRMVLRSNVPLLVFNAIAMRHRPLPQESQQFRKPAKGETAPPILPPEP